MLPFDSSLLSTVPRGPGRVIAPFSFAAGIPDLVAQRRGLTYVFKCLRGPVALASPSKHHRTPPRKPPEPYPSNPATPPSSAKFQHLLPTVYLPEPPGTYLDFAPQRQASLHHQPPGPLSAPLRLSCPTRRRNIRHPHPHPHLFYILCPPRRATLLTSLARP